MEEGEGGTTTDVVPPMRVLVVLKVGLFLKARTES
jgi:hypothetical protein